MNDKIPPHNSKTKVKDVLKTSLLFFVVVSILAVCYEVFKEDIDPFLNKYAPGSVEFLASGAETSGVTEVKK
jgi:hypothetical protein